MNSGRDLALRIARLEAAARDKSPQLAYSAIEGGAIVAQPVVNVEAAPASRHLAIENHGVEGGLLQGGDSGIALVHGGDVGTGLGQHLALELEDGVFVVD